MPSGRTRAIQRPGFTIRAATDVYKRQAFIKDLCLRRVQILGLRVAHDTASEADDPMIGVHNREHHPVPELVIDAAALVHAEQPRLLQEGVRIDVYKRQLPVLRPSGCVLSWKTGMAGRF